MKRRHFIKLSATSSAIGLMPFDLQAALKPLMPLIDCPDASNRKLVLVNLAGGNDGLNTTVPLDQYDIYSNLRPTVKIKDYGTNKYINLDNSLPDNQQIGLNPALINFKTMYDEGRMRIIQGVGYPRQNKSHFKSQDLYDTGNDGNSSANGTRSGWIGRFMELFYSDLIIEPFPLAVQIGSTKTSLGFHGDHEHGMSINLTGQDPAGYYTVLDALAGQSPEEIPNSDYGTELKFIADIDALSNQNAEAISNAFNSGTNAVTYPNTDISNQLKTVAKLISGDLGTKVYMVRISGFDTHNAQVESASDTTGKHHDLLTKLSEAIKSFFDDLNSQNIGNDVVGLTYSEFGRKAAENGNLGTDHGEIAPMFVFGNAVEGGVSGTNPDLTEAHQDNNYQIKTVQYDYRQTFGTLLQDFLGADDTVIDGTFFNHSSNESFTTTKIEQLIKSSFAITEACRNGIDEETPISEKLWHVYPNPVENELNLVTTEDVDEVEYRLHTTSGILVMHNHEAFDYGKASIIMAGLVPGVYFLQIRVGEHWETHKLLKK